MFDSMKQSLRDFDRERVMDLVGLERRRTTAERAVPIIAFFGVGILVGVGIGLMTAPRSGSQLRRELKGKFQEAVPRATEAIESAVEQAKQTVKNPRPSASHS